MSFLETLAIALITGGVASGIITAIIERGKRKADASESISQAATAMLDPLTKRVKALEDEIAELRKKISTLESEGLTKDKIIAGLETKLRKKDTRIAQLEARVHELECEVKQLRGEDAAKEKEPDGSEATAA